MERWRMALLLVTEQEETEECQSGWKNMKYKKRENKKQQEGGENKKQQEGKTRSNS